MNRRPLAFLIGIALLTLLLLNKAQFSAVQAQSAVDITSGSWTTSTPLPEAFGHTPAIVYKQIVYLAGGEGPSGSVRTTIYRAGIDYNGAITSWTPSKALTQPRHYHAMVEANGYLYLLGGYTPGNSLPLSTITYAKINDLGDLDTWNTTTLPVALGSPMAVVTGGRLYVLGGHNGTTNQTTVYYTSANANGSLGSWATTTALPQGLSWGGVVVAKGRLYVAGGATGNSRTNATYSAVINADGTLGNWNTLPALPKALANHVLARSGNALYVIGGFDGSASQKSVYTASLQADGSLGNWTTMPDLPQPLHDQAGLFYSNLYIFGGFNSTTGAYQNTVYVNQVAFSCDSQPDIPKTECDALVTLYNSTNGSNWKFHRGWLVTNAPCNWDGVTCYDGHVTGLDLHLNQLSGSIPAQLANLTYLDTLSLSENQLSGPIPPELGTLTKLVWLSLDTNQLSGSIPPQLGNLANLQQLYLQLNQLSGNVPSELGQLTKLQRLQIDNTQLSGALPSSLPNLKQLQWFFFDQTNLCEPPDTAFQAWLTGIPTLHRTNRQCPGSTACFSDEFSASSLASDWTWIDPLGDSSYSLTANVGNLRIQAPDRDHDLNPFYETNAPRIMQSITGDFDVSTKVTVHPLYTFQAAGLVVWFDQNNFIWLGRALNNSIGQSFYRAFQGVNAPWAEGITATTVYLRVTRQGNTLSTSYSLDGTTWTALNSIDYPSAPTTASVGLFVLNNWQDNLLAADFDYFRCAGDVSSITGKVTDANNNPIAEVTISADAGHTTSTDASGNYTLPGLPAGTYTLTPSKNGYTFSPASLSVTMPLDRKDANFIATSTANFSIDISPVQVVEGADLVVNKPLAVKVTIIGNTSQDINDVRLTLHYNNGANELLTFYPNSPEYWNDSFQLNTMAGSLSFAANASTKREVYFIADDLKPTATGQYSIGVTLSWLGGQISSVRQFNAIEGWQKQRILFLPIQEYTNSYSKYVPKAIDLINAVYPVAPGLIQSSPCPPFCPQPYYFKAPNQTRLEDALTILLYIGYMTDPSANRIVGVTPNGFVQEITHQDWAGVTNLGILNVVLADNSDDSQWFAQEIAHELGHTWGHPDHESAGTPGNPSFVLNGFWPSQKQRMQQSDMLLNNMQHQVVNIMCCLLTSSSGPKDAWFTLNAYQRFINAGTPHTQASSRLGANRIKENGGSILVTGLIYADGHIELKPWYRMSISPPYLPAGDGDYSIEIRDTSGSVLYSSRFLVDFTVGNPPITLNVAPFGFSIPDFDTAASVIVRRSENTIAQRSISLHAPNVTIITPQPNQQITPSDLISWSANDADGDTLTYSVLISTDGGVTWNPLAIGISTNQLALDSLLPSGEQYYLKIIATDNVNTSTALSGPFKLLGMTRAYLPLIKK